MYSRKPLWLLAAALVSVGGVANAQSLQPIGPTTPSCLIIPTYQVKAGGLEPVGTQCAPQAGQGQLNALAPQSFFAPAMIIEVSPSVKIMVPHRQPGVRIIRVGGR